MPKRAPIIHAGTARQGVSRQQQKAAMLPRCVALNCLARTCCVNAAVTARGMQQIGLAFVLAPAFRCLYPNREDRARAFARYGGHSNTHVFMVPLYVGIVLSLEMQIARGALPESAAGVVRETLGTTLSALGDSFFSGALLPLWALTSAFLLLAGQTGLAAMLAVVFLALLLLFRVLTFFAGLRHGMPVLLRLKRLNLINWVERLKILNAVMVILVVSQLPLRHLNPFPWLLCGLAAAAVLGASWLVGRMHLPRILLWALVLGALILMDAGLMGM